jgi:murein DD-endopeptidase MepM/ murein hydrolase activator NlpD
MELKSILNVFQKRWFIILLAFVIFNMSTMNNASASQIDEEKGVEFVKNQSYIDSMYELADIFAYAGKIALSRGEIIVCPVESATFVSSFGAPRSGHTHQGVDMMAPDGTPIVAPESGLYEQHGSESFYLYGNSGTMYFGTHLQEHVAPSGYVSAGDLVALVGHTGNASASGPHLHFEIHPGDGEAIDPYPRTAAACF